MNEADYPVTPYYKTHVLDGVTLARIGRWWTAVLLIRNPRTNKPFIGLYRWELSGDVWKVRKRFSFKSLKEVRSAMDVIERFSKHLESEPGAVAERPA